MKNKKEEMLQEGMKLVSLYRKYPVLAAKDILGIDLPVPQQRILNDLWFKNYIAVSAGRGVGKTYLAAVFASLWAMLHPGQKVGLLAPSFRQAKNMFSEVERIWSVSPIFQEATNGKPIRGSDRCSLTFKQSGRLSPSIIEAIPLGDGGKIRGARYYVVIADEFAFFPVDIFNTAIIPMGATNANPMENVRRLAKQDELIEKGLAVESDFESMISNKIVMLSSAYYQFNHMYQTIQDHRQKIEAGDARYGLHSISYRDMPKGFLSKENIQDAKSRLPSVQFRMEYEAIWEADSAGIFKASLIDKCQRLAKHTVELSGRAGAQYVLGVDPARVSDASGFCLIELGAPCKVVAAWEHYRVPYPELAKLVMQVCNDYNVVAVNIDSGAGGGGSALKDILFMEETFGARRLLDAGDEDTRHMTGRRILHMAHPSPTNIAESVNATVSMMEHGNMAFPLRPSTFPISGAELEAKEDLYDTVDDMIKQLMLIEATQNKAGTAHYDVPAGGGHAGQKKDLYSAFILAAKKAYDIFMMLDQPKTILEVGIIEQRTTYSPMNSSIIDNDVLPAPLNSWAYKKNFNPR